MSSKYYIDRKSKKDISKYAIAELEKGNDKLSLLEELSMKYSDKYTIAAILADIPHDNLRSKYYYINITLVFLLMTNALFQISCGIEAVLNVINLGALIILIPVVLLSPLLNIFFSISIKNFRGSYYILTLCFGVIGMLNTNSSSISKHFGGYANELVGNLSFMCVIMIVITSFITKNKSISLFWIFRS